MRVWVIGSHGQCDVVVDSPLASGRHCRLTRLDSGFLLEDLDSTNGTFIDGVKLTAATRVQFGDPITLGRSVPMPWPPEILRHVTIGRVAGNELVLDDPRVSSRHARLILVDGDGCCIEDLGSANGTFLNRPDQRVTIPTRLSFTDTIYFGTFAVPASRLLGAIAPTEPQTAVATAVPPVDSVRTDTKPGERPRMPSLGGIPGLWWLVLAAKAALLAILIVLFFGRRADSPANAASTSFLLGLLALWLGTSVAILDAASSSLLFKRERPGNMGRLAALAASCAALSALALAIVQIGGGRPGNGLTMWLIMTLASAVGLNLGLVVGTQTRSAVATLLILGLLLVPSIVLGGRIWRLPQMNPAMRLAATAVPSRWAFEGLLLSGSDTTSNLAPADLAEPYFPAETERMGTLADALALALMAIGLAGAWVFISLFSKARRETP
jgi:pSer/pThr/pTyr-binding forkhead associated (FHA) protein